MYIYIYIYIYIYRMHLRATLIYTYTYIECTCARPSRVFSSSSTELPPSTPYAYSMFSSSPVASIRQHTSAYGSIRLVNAVHLEHVRKLAYSEHTSAYVSTRGTHRTCSQARMQQTTSVHIKEIAVKQQ